MSQETKMRFFNKSSDELLATHFKANEFGCKCSAIHRQMIHQELVDKLEALRIYLNRPIRITSAYRCKTHNKQVGGVSNSMHVLGKAADINVSGISTLEVALLASRSGFNGIGLYDTFVHVDIRPGGYVFWDARTQK